MVDESEKTSRIPRRFRGVVLFLRDAAVAAFLVACILLIMFAYTGLWPPLVVVESESMMHGGRNISHIGTIDTGDLVLVKNVDGVNDIETYVDGLSSGHRTYGDYGDVIIYKVDGRDTRTPIIHRAIIYLELNPGGLSFRAEALRDAPSSKWTASNQSNTWDNLTNSITLLDIGWASEPVMINIGHYLASHSPSGFVTKGDNNPSIDQSVGSLAQFSWIVGKARGEIPWFGLLKLWSTHSLGSAEPLNSVRNLWISIAVIVISPIVIDIALTFKERREIAAKKAAEESKKKAEAEDSSEPEGLQKRP